MLRRLHLLLAPAVAGGIGVGERIGAARTGVAVGLALTASALTDRLLGPAPLTAADHVTRARLSLVTGAAARMLAAPITGSSPARAATVTLAVALDAADGAVARRTGQVTARGRRFDGEADAVAVAVLSSMTLHLTRWAVVPGSLRYLFGAAQAVLPPLHGPLAPSPVRRSVAAAAMSAMAVSTWPRVPPRRARALVVGAALTLLLSFGRDTVHLLRTAPSRRLP